jgi:uncharacterized protein YbbK (DUF523 family)
MHTMNHEHLKKHIAENEYAEGRDATANFERLAKTVFQAKKKVALPVAVPKKTSGKPSPGKGRA